MNLKLARPIAFVDVEATGAGRVDPVKYRIVSVAIVTLGFDCFPIGRPYHTLVNPGVPISPETTAIHGITDEMVKDAPRFEAIVAELQHRLIGRDIGGYNAGGFDVQILYEESLRAGNELKCLLDAKIIDPGMIFKKREERSLTAAVKFFCGREMVGAHDALNDVWETIAVLRAQFERYPDLPADTDSLAAYCQYDDRLTWDNKIIRGPDGDPVYNFGKQEGTKVKDDTSFAYWILSKDFPSQTKAVLRKILDDLEAQEAEERKRNSQQPELAIQGPEHDDVPF